jgi:hypothetical protein
MPSAHTTKGDTVRNLTEAQHARLDSKHLGDDIKVVGWNDEVGGPKLYNPSTGTYAILTPNGAMRPTNA